MPATAAALAAGLAVLLLGLSPAAGQAPSAEQSQPLVLDETLAGSSAAAPQPGGELASVTFGSSPGSGTATARPEVPPALLAPAYDPPFPSADAALAGSGAAPPATDFATLTETEVFPSLLQAAAPGDEVPAVSGEQLASQALESPAFPAEDLLGQEATAELGAATAPTEAGAAGGQPAPPERSNFSSLISLLSPPPDFVPPELSEQQRYNLPRLQQLRQATGTVSVRRTVGNFGGSDMACGMGYLSDYFANYFVGLPQELFRGAQLCGACVRIWCVDSICLDPLVRNATFMVTDSCRDCRGQDLLVSAPGFAELTGVDINISPTLQIAWTLEPCAPFIRGGIRMLASDKNNPTFLAFNFSNLRQLLREVSIGGLPFQYTDYGYWELNSPGRDIPLAPPYRLQLTAADGQTLVKLLPSLRSQDLGVNFNA